MKTALVAGTNKGIGLEFSRQLKEKGDYVIGCCRNPDQADNLLINHFENYWRVVN